MIAALQEIALSQFFTVKCENDRYMGWDVQALLDSPVTRPKRWEPLSWSRLSMDVPHWIAGTTVQIDERRVAKITEADLAKLPFPFLVRLSPDLGHPVDYECYRLIDGNHRLYAAHRMGKAAQTVLIVPEIVERDIRFSEDLARALHEEDINEITRLWPLRTTANMESLA